MFKSLWVMPPVLKYAKEHIYHRIGDNKWELYLNKVKQAIVSYTDVQILGYVSHGAKFVEEPEWFTLIQYPRVFLDISSHNILVYTTPNKAEILNIKHFEVGDYTNHIDVPLGRSYYTEIKGEKKEKFLNFTKNFS